MKFTLTRQIYFHSPDAGLISRYISKEVDSEISPQVGYKFDDSAWHRNDETKAEEIVIDTETGHCTVTLNSKIVGAASDVEKFCKLAIEHHDWRHSH